MLVNVEYDHIHILLVNGVNVKKSEFRNACNGTSCEIVHTWLLDWWWFSGVQVLRLVCILELFPSLTAICNLD